MNISIQYLTENDDFVILESVNALPVTKELPGITLDEYQNIANTWKKVQLPTGEIIEVRALSSKRKPKISISIKQNDDVIFSFLGDEFHALTTRTILGAIIGIGVGQN